ncbi:predicted protein [Naegleria gruberi]|uniref:Predicted protein n=1 Tax=Naegleria gruberi TaxID=5762 RepID=D2W017_NAEGR|nr:uncharacterized protein NAEGRDRAFT_74697 [Naegleria gruberi]EFC37669.1 predicted protein [Naegleria gruberi]|eukprot:XP_002670413.1 predicted protein [Naegleria gruberi strain NEG-M]
MTSHTFVISAYFLCFLSQILFWIILGGIDEIIHSNTKNENEPHFFVIPGFFQFSYGCIGSSAMFGIIIAEALVYYIVEWITLVLCIRSDRDTWNIKKETLVHVIVQPFLVILFIVLGSIPIIAELVDYFVPYLLVLLAGSVFEIFVCVVLPVCYDIRLDFIRNGGLFSINSKNRNITSFSTTEILLKDPKTYSIFLDFARRSYTPEPVLCWTDIQKFKKLPKKDRKEKALKMIDSYISLSAPLELNLPNINVMRRDLLNIIEKDETNIPIELFENVETLCLQDLLDLQQRLVDQNDFIASLVE